MGIKTTYVCDVTGEGLPSDTKPHRITWAGQGYELYLSDKGLKQINEFLDPVLAEAQKVTYTTSAPRRRATSATKGRDDLNNIRAWAAENGWEVADRGRIKQEVVDAYDEAQKAKTA